MDILTTRKLLLHHLLSGTDETHKTPRFEACDSPLYPKVLAHGVPTSTQGCGAFFDAGSSGISKPLGAHLARGRCRDRRPRALPREVDGTYLAKSISGVRTALTTQLTIAKTTLHIAPPHSEAVDFCCVNLGFTQIHLRTSSSISATSLPKPCPQHLLHGISHILAKASTTRGEVLREAAWGALFLLPTLVLGP